MGMILDFLGFNSVNGIIWNSIGYGAFIGIIVGVFNDKYRNLLFMICGAVLSAYAGLFLGNQVFMVLQALIALSALFQLAGLDKRMSGMFLSIATFLSLLLLLLLVRIDFWDGVGAFGLLALIFGILMLPAISGFKVMTVGGLLLVVFGFVSEAWVFFFLNIFFVWANWRQIRRLR